MSHGMRYKPFGVMVDKTWLFARGGRPVIYQSDAEYDLLKLEQQWRHVRYEPDRGIDFTWEREWRVQVDQLELDMDAATLVIPTRDWERRFHDQHIAGLQRRSMLLTGMMSPKSVAEIPWHFVVLEDLGVPLPAEASQPENTG